MSHPTILIKWQIDDKKGSFNMPYTSKTKTSNMNSAIFERLVAMGVVMPEDEDLFGLHDPTSYNQLEGEIGVEAPNKSFFDYHEIHQ